ncbi:MAG: acetate kinase [Neisseriaceae bacterium]|nr:acetate kinase [Neisseriaceae bacterium]MBP6862815.1 acetate kinase [Neisseriaceae bacterium]
MNKLVLVLNCGSSSVKFSVIEVSSGETFISGLAEKLNLADATITFKQGEDKEVVAMSADGSHRGAIMMILAKLKEVQLFEAIGAVGHRVVHGGERFSESVIIDHEVLYDIEACFNLAPLHNPAHLMGINVAQEAFGHLKHVAVFDTAFHQSMPPHAFLYAVPMVLYREHSVRRYGAHGTSYRYVSKETARLLDKPKEALSMIIAHLGNGSSITAIANGQCQDTSMGLTPLEGLVMGTRSGDIDPSIFSFLKQNRGYDIQEVTTMLNRRSGLKGLSELSSDCRELTAAAEAGHKGAQIALDVFAYRLAKYVGSMMVAAGGLDVLVFTGGIGENSAYMREKVLGYLGCFGLKLDKKANADMILGRAGVISSSKTPIAMVVPTNEEYMIALDTAKLVNLD